MLKFEKKIIEWINLHMVPIAMMFIIAAAVYVRAAGIKFMGIDFHYALYDIPGNCHSVLYRNIAFAAMRNPELAVILLKLLSYLGDIIVAILVLILFLKEEQQLVSIRSFLILTACLLSPVSLIYSVGNMRPDSVCMSLVLFGIILYKKNILPGAILITGVAAYLYPVYWPITTGLWIYSIREQYRKGKGFHKNIAVNGVVMCCLLLLNVMTENQWQDNGYFWGKIFVYNPQTESFYVGVGEWLLKMLRLYGYVLAMGIMIASFRFRKLRIWALILQILIVIYVGWITTSHLIVT